MKIAWFTPFNIESAIGRYSKFATETLQKYIDVDILVFQKRGKLHDTECKVVFYKDQDVKSLLKNYDLAVYNMGDYAPYHAAIYEVLKQVPSIIIMHDVSMYGFMSGYYLEYKKDFDGFKKMLEDNYGKADMQMILDASKDYKSYSKLDLVKYNLAEHIADNAFGVIVHSQYHKNIIRDFYKGSLAVITILDMNDKLDEIDKRNNVDSYAPGKYHILTVGNINENKRIHSMIIALGQDKLLASKFDYTIIGSTANVKYCETLRSLIDKYNLNEQVRIVGYVNHRELAYYYHGADLISNLRFPAYEGASASIAEQMILGKACIVSDTGIYAELSDDSLLKINPQHELEEINRTLRNIISHPELIKLVGENAKKFAKLYFNRDLYGERVYEFFKEIVFQRPLHVVKNKCLSVMECMPTALSTDIPYYLVEEINKLYNNSN